MRKFILIGFVCSVVFSCKRKDDPLKYYSAAQKDSLMVELITYIYKYPQGADWQTRFDPKYRSYYVSQLSKFRFEKYQVDDWGVVHFFYILRPARNSDGSLRGVGGFFKKNKEGTITSFREVFNTPVLTLPELKERGGEMFRWMAMKGHVNEYLKNPDYVEWPNPQSAYDTIRHEWVTVN